MPGTAHTPGRLPRVPLTGLRAGWAGLLSLLVLLAAAVPAAASPRIVAEQVTYDFGSLTNGMPLVHDFTIRNAGDSNLEIRRVVTSCAVCMRATVDRNVLAPGGTCVLRCMLDLRQLAGDVAKEVLVYSNDPATETVEFQVTGVVLPFYQLEPSAVRLDYSQGERAATVDIEAAPDLRAPLTLVECGDPRITASVSKLGRDHYELQVHAASSMPRGNTSASVVVKSADPADPACIVSVLVQNPADVEVIPEKIRIQHGAGPKMAVLMIKQHGPTPDALLDVVPPSDKFQCEIAPDPMSNDYRIFISARDLASGPGDMGSLVIKLRDANNRDVSMSVPISVY